MARLIVFSQLNVSMYSLGMQRRLLYIGSRIRSVII